MDETGEVEVLNLGKVTAPWGKEIVMQALTYKSGLRLARSRIREGRRFTVLDLDAQTAEWIVSTLAEALGTREKTND